ncbi:MFS transporter [Haloactinopolyspora sp.]|uniref:MFS transporter n=1 Tax=Haloactinopolyspora sp. TaxID=1966353 RepID=UPI00260B9E88|nr:MFS transporter [Haloactinopolyspora sp.]
MSTTTSTTTSTTSDPESTVTTSATTTSKPTSSTGSSTGDSNAPTATADRRDNAAASAPRPGWRDSFAALRARNYRLYVSSQVLTNTCGWMQRIAQDWLILSLTGNVALVGLTVTLQLGPMLLFGLWGGVIADRFDKRRVLMITQSLFGVSALAVGLLTLTGVVQPWHILASAAFLGLATVVDNPARQAFVPEVAGHQHLRSAISLNSTVFQMGALVGPALAGAGIAAVGEGWAFVVNSVACTAAVLLLVAMRPNELSRPPAVRRARGQLREGLRYVSGKPEILWTVVLVGFVGLTGINMATVLAAYAYDVFDTGSGGFGLLNSCLAAGAVVGALANTRRRSLRLRHLVFGAAALGCLQLLAAGLRSQVLFSVVLVSVGAAALLYLTGGNTLIQTSVAATMRGRVMALYILVFFGAQAASGSIIGWVAHHHGAPWAMVACASGPLIGALIVGSILAHRGGFAPKVILRDRPGRGVIYVVSRDELAARARQEPKPSRTGEGPRRLTTGAGVTAALRRRGRRVPVLTAPPHRARVRTRNERGAEHQGATAPRGQRRSQKLNRAPLPSRVRRSARGRAAQRTGDR